jgi:hypothetical protein
MKFIESVVEGNYYLSKADMYMEGNTSVIGLFRLNHPIYPYFDLNSFVDTHSQATQFIYYTVVKSGEYLVSCEFSMKLGRTNNASIINLLNYFDDQVKFFTKNVDCKAMVKLCKNI